MIRVGSIDFSFQPDCRHLDFSSSHVPEGEISVFSNAMNTPSGYNAAFWLAVVGAAAWVPQIIGWIAKAVARPSVKVLPGQSVEIGFNNLGPIVNVPIAMLVKRKDALITAMNMRAVYENGETHTFQWMWIHEVISFVRGLPQNMNFAKQDRAIALLASRGSLVNKSIGFQDAKFLQDYKEKGTALLNQYKFQKDRPNGREEFLQSRELAAELEWLNNAMFWTDGKYRLEIDLQVEGLASKVEATFFIVLTKPEVDMLRQNADKMRDHVVAMVNADAQGQTAPEPAWNWINPTLSIED
jgi:hypothetical protein